MNLFRTVLATLLALGTITTAARAQLKEVPADKPSIAMKTTIRQEGEKPNNCRVECSWALSEMALDHEIELRYQLRIHTKAGEVGEVLATQKAPTGAAYIVARGRPDKNGEAKFAKEYLLNPSSFVQNTNLPTNARNLVIRFEPLVYDLTDDGYLNEVKPAAAVVVIDTDENSRVQKIQPIADWFRGQFADSKAANCAVETIASLDCKDLGQHKLILQAWEEMLNKKDLEDETLEILIRALPAIDIVTFLDSRFEARLKELGKHDKGNIRDAAKAKLVEITRTAK
jgi:hypothetical protein